MGLFRRKRDEFDFDKLAAKETATTTRPDPLGMNQPSPFDQAPFTPPGTDHGFADQRQLDLISSKIDTIKVMLNSIEQRLARLEQQSQQPVQQQSPERRLW